MQFADYLDAWIELYVIPFRAANTAACYRRAIASLPGELLSSELESIDGMQLQRVINRQAIKHPRAAQLTYTMLHVALAKAVQLGYIARNPADACECPRHEAKRATVLRLDDIRAYLQEARAEPSYPLLLMMATMGLRRGEALGLTMCAIDLTRCTVSITQQRLRVNGAYTAASLKSRASKRVLPLPPPIAAELRVWLAGLKVRPCRTAWLVDRSPEALARDHARALQRAGLPHVRLHDLRHSMATVLAANGCAMKVLQGILGHARFELTANLYADHIDGHSYAPHLAMFSAALMG